MEGIPGKFEEPIRVNEIYPFVFFVKVVIIANEGAPPWRDNRMKQLEGSAEPQRGMLFILK